MHTRLCKLAVLILVALIIIKLFMLASACNLEKLKVVKMENRTVFRALSNVTNKNTRIHISGTLDPFSCDAYGILKLSKKSTVVITLMWHPESAVLMLGLCSAKTGLCDLTIVSGGEASAHFTAWRTGQYYVLVCNLSLYVVEYDGYIEVHVR